MAGSMRASRFHEYGDPSVLRLEKADRPVPAAGQVLVRVRAAGVNAIDWKFRAGYLKDFAPLEFPHIPGFDLAGIVEEAGPEVSEFAAGDEVFGRGSGAYAEFAVAPTATIARKPLSLSFEAAASLPIGGVTAWVALFDVAHLERGQRILIQGGAGGVGSLAVQLAHWKGAHVIATTSTANVDFVRSLGADEVVDYTSSRFEDTAGDMDVVFDTVGGEVTERSWTALRPGGILVTAAAMPQPDRAAELGVRTAGVQPPPTTRPILEELLRLIDSGHLAPQVGPVLPLSAAAEAHAMAQTGHGRSRIVLRVPD